MALLASVAAYLFLPPGLTHRVQICFPGPPPKPKEGMYAVYLIQSLPLQDPSLASLIRTFWLTELGETRGLFPRWWIWDEGLSHKICPSPQTLLLVMGFRPDDLIIHAGGHNHGPETCDRRLRIRVLGRAERIRWEHHSCSGQEGACRMHLMIMQFLIFLNI